MSGIYGVLKYIDLFCVAIIDSVLLYGQDKRHAQIPWPVCRMYIYVSQTGPRMLGLMACACCCFMMTPGAKRFCHCSLTAQGILSTLISSIANVEECTLIESHSGVKGFVHGKLSPC